ncbi:MAG: tRNA (adenosine(37)-N6)-threonylcarbamoyltransferase complex ATPase subunit type 1 TsaE [Aeriscardovia sp.]|nr:tRNA (adenosine(37)-N6)-threonylcarbamoyltransferase complex ATPase subunit type 1 TsaE [Aeriscardovia sp.]
MPEEVKVATGCARETRKLGEILAPFLSPGDLLILRGPLGAGKTTFTQGLGEGLGAERAIISPTFTLAREVKVKFSGGRPGLLIHVDAWRLKAQGGDIFEEFEALGIEDDFEGSNALVVAEWGDGIAEALSDRILYVDFARSAQRESKRVVAFTPKGFGALAGFRKKAEEVFGNLVD